MTTRAALTLSLLAALMPIVAASKCGTGNAPSYADIDAVMLTQNGCKGTIQDPIVATLKSPSFPQGIRGTEHCGAALLVRGLSQVKPKRC
jgi:hypothetical protein